MGAKISKLRKRAKKMKNPIPTGSPKIHTRDEPVRENQRQTLGNNLQAAIQSKNYYDILGAHSYLSLVYVPLRRRNRRFKGVSANGDHRGIPAIQA
jgi:hypothetical protein